MHIWTCNLALTCTSVTNYSPLRTSYCILLKPGSLLNVALSHCESHNSAGWADSTTFFSSFLLPRLINSFHPSSAETDAVCPFTAHHHHHNGVKTQSSGFFAACMYGTHGCSSMCVLYFFLSLWSDMMCL